MSKICDRSPCDDLMKALGHFIFGSMNGDVLHGFILRYGEEGSQVEVRYCPFCGTRLEEINATILRKFVKTKVVVQEDAPEEIDTDDWDDDEEDETEE